MRKQKRGKPYNSVRLAAFFFSSFQNAEAQRHMPILHSGFSLLDTASAPAASA